MSRRTPEFVPRRFQQPAHYRGRRSALAISILLAIGLTTAAEGPSSDQPPPDDPSAYTDQPRNAGDTRNILKGAPPANQGAFEQANGVTGSRTTVLAENVLPPARQTDFDIPTNGRPSPLFNAKPFTQQMLRFEAFGLEPLDPSTPSPPAGFPQPSLGAATEQDPTNLYRSGPSGSDLDEFLSAPGLFPFPSQYSNDLDGNPWNALVQGFLRRPVRGPGQGLVSGRGDLRRGVRRRRSLGPLRAGPPDGGGP